jgi:hypothetical protein
MEAYEDARAAVKRCRVAWKSLKRKREDTFTLSKWCLKTALCISCICNYDFAAGYAWLDDKRRRGATLPAHATQAEIVQLLEEHFLRADVDELMSWVDPPSSTLHRTVLKTAIAFARMHALAGWVEHINNQCGSVVRTERLIEHYNAAGLTQPNDVCLLPAVQSHTKYCGRKWAQRWRVRFGAKYGHLIVREPIERHEIFEKA